MNGNGFLSKEQLSEMYEKLTSKNINTQEIDLVFLDMEEKLKKGFRRTTDAEWFWTCHVLSFDLPITILINLKNFLNIYQMHTFKISFACSPFAQGQSTESRMPNLKKWLCQSWSAKYYLIALKVVQLTAISRGWCLILV